MSVPDERKRGIQVTNSGIHIVSSTDEGYFPHFCAMLHSAWLYNPDANFYLLDAGISPASLDKLKEFVALKKIKLSIIYAADRIRTELPDYKKRSAFGRVFIPELIPTELNRVAYFDSDMTIVGDLQDLFETDLGGNVIGACVDSVESTVDKETKVQAVDFGKHYFNSGIMLIDIKRWRELNVTERALTFAREYPAKLLYMDQSPLNVILHNQVKFLDRKWNYYLLEGRSVDPTDLRIIHHCDNFADRPWKSAINPFAELYRFHRNQTPCPAGDKIHVTIGEKAQRIRRRILAHIWPSKYLHKANRYKTFVAAERLIAIPALERAKSRI